MSVTENIPYSVFRIPYSVFRIPYSVFRIPYSVFRKRSVPCIPRT
ncbi:CRISPR-associated protein Cas5 [Vibrio mytili]